MNAALPFVVIVIAMSSGGHAIARDCDLSEIDGARELHEVLSRRAVEVIARASSDDWAGDQPLARFVTPAATFNLGSGDVGRSFETGIAGAHTLATTMRAANYRYLGWDYMNLPVNACERREVTVEFSNPSNRSVAQIAFIFEGGKVVSATGWQRSFEAGSLAEVGP